MVHNSYSGACPVFNYKGNSIAEWAAMLEEFERSIHYGDRFNFSVNEIALKPSLLHTLRCISVGDFERCERMNVEFQQEVVFPLITIKEQTVYKSSERFNDFLIRSKGVSQIAIESAGDAFVSIKWLMNKQSEQTLNERLLQASDYIDLFYDPITLDLSTDYVANLGLISSEFDGLFGRYMKQKNPWLRFCIGGVVIDFLEGRSFVFDSNAKSKVEFIRKDVSRALAKWSRRP
jgi:hypothetical protein